MSYILDALRRAEAERRRGEPPALDQVARWPTLDTAPARPRDGRAGWLLTLAAALCLALAVAAWWGWSRPSPTAAPPLATAPVTAPAPPPPRPVVAQPSAEPAATPLTPTLSPRGEDTNALSRKAGEGRGEGGSAGLNRTTSKQSTAAAKPAASTASAPVAPAASAPAPPPVNAATLPEAQRSALARLGLAGGVYSPERSQRFVLVGGQIAHEGDPLAPGIVLERIQPRSVLLRVEGRLVEMPL